MSEKTMYEKLINIVCNTVVEYMANMRLTNILGDLSDLVLTIENNYIFGNIDENQYDALIKSCSQAKKMYKLLEGDKNDTTD